MNDINNEGGNSNRKRQKEIKRITRMHRTPNGIFVGKIAIGKSAREKSDRRKKIKEDILVFPKNNQKSVEHFRHHKEQTENNVEDRQEIAKEKNGARSIEDSFVPKSAFEPARPDVIIQRPISKAITVAVGSGIVIAISGDGGIVDKRENREGKVPGWKEKKPIEETIGARVNVLVAPIVFVLQIENVADWLVKLYFVIEGQAQARRKNNDGENRHLSPKEKPIASGEGGPFPIEAEKRIKENERNRKSRHRCR